LSNGPREQIVSALLELLTSSIASTFTADTTLGSAELTNPSSTIGLFLGMPINACELFPTPTFIADLGPPLVLSEVATATATGAVFTTGWRTTSRRLQWWTETPNQPALFVRNVGDEYPPRAAHALPPNTTMDCEVWIYSNAGQNPCLAPSVGLNNLIDAVKSVLDPVPGSPQTLGLTGTTVQHCWIEGTIDMHPGDLDGQAIAVIPVKILAPGL
jgi:hypothetical protein